LGGSPANILGALNAMGLTITELKEDPKHSSKLYEKAFNQARKWLGDRRGEREIRDQKRAEAMRRQKELVREVAETATQPEGA